MNKLICTLNTIDVFIINLELIICLTLAILSLEYNIALSRAVEKQTIIK